MARQDERISCLFLVNMTQVLETVVWSLTFPPVRSYRGIFLSVLRHSLILLSKHKQHETRPRPYADLPLHFTARCLPSTKPGPGLNLGVCNVSTGAQSSYLLTRLLPSTRRVVFPGGTEIPDEPPDVMLRARISEPTERASPPQYCKRKKGVCLFLAC